MEEAHISVLKKETIDSLNVKEDGIYVDCTLGRAGHALEISKQLSEKGQLIGFDQDLAAIKAARDILPENSILIHDNFRHLKASLHTRGITSVDGILLDLGVSSPQLDEKERGFSYQQDAPLDMRMDQTQSLTAKQVVNEWPYEQLVKIFFTYGEEKFSKQIARKIEEIRKEKEINTTFELVEIIKQAIPAPARRKGGHPAKRTFQAIRIAVNDELESFSDVLNQAAELLTMEGRLSVITFHSLEDRICKKAFKKYSTEKPFPKEIPVVPEGHQPPFYLHTRNPIVPNNEEIEQNRRARSSKLRVIEKVKEWDPSFSYNP